jgi:hypothetical protein
MTLALTIMLQVIYTKFSKGIKASIVLFWSEVSLTLLICLFEVVIGI